ncbi:uncharacterized protein L3040_004098 [Drepanopeziza brunnea f. sp. 'multigermtubi']|uniref:Pentatricopeptide repeat domain-containing protein n=1 Tax=Marssonina brunnea f. sp. multigermtubi (strain MB_m1) TaxID=1072389 RepID=K1Y129_MARBU|nr:uncharacterized protein MBM_03091 [Drepanopeziza brunnea f. sp. 'multigermtubi' MB_m1]EKD18849.1 hypothetical protein MBM_03091 [Drepanopeziza brunnea f. sp. 'multigermtubi' MB_m1]KAJ5042699.1 hypothetical protein L3040_004098 [Drepanopeziza brunnea f. sp. 'multigermtubi']
MRPALQKLVQRPNVRELLRFLVEGNYAQSYAPANIGNGDCRRRFCGWIGCVREPRRRNYASVASAASKQDECSQEGREDGKGPKYHEWAQAKDCSIEGTGDTAPTGDMAMRLLRRAQVPSESRAGTGRATFSTPDTHPLPPEPGGLQLVERVMPPGNEPDLADTQELEEEKGRHEVLSSKRLPRPAPVPLSPAILPPVAKTILGNVSAVSSNRWEETKWTHEQLDFESSLDQWPLPEGSKGRLLDSATFSHDFDLWALFLGYRKRIYGTEGVRLFWNQIRERGILIPTAGPLADQVWSTFVDLGIEDPSVLPQIIDYADLVLQHDGRRWSKLYSRIIQQLLTSDHAKLAHKWHKRLIQNHPPGPRGFAEMCRHIVFKSGDLVALRIIHRQCPYRNTYGKIIPALCEKEDFTTATKWHDYLVDLGDLPSSAKMAYPLIQHYDKYKPLRARRLVSSLVNAGVPSADTLAKGYEGYQGISREMMNLIHGETHNIPVKQYNDKLGARWFATEWISLDVAINGVTALGVQSIGPLSLQAMVLREPDLKLIYSRIAQLRAGGVSIGNSLYSQAVESFAKDGKYDLLASLLNSDQHPDELENFELQESLLSAYVKAGDWAQYRRTMAIRLLSSTSPESEKQNIELRVIASTGNVPSVLNGVEDMIINGIEFEPRTITCLIRSILFSRQKGRHPMSRRRDPHSSNRPTDLDSCILMLKSIVRCGAYIEPQDWHEIIRRLGMLGRLHELKELLLWLANVYRGNCSTSWAKKYHVPREVQTSVPQHPLRTLFAPDLQRAIVEWGFITNSRHQNLQLSAQRQLHTRTNEPRQLTWGILLLRDLNRLGVFIDGRAVRKSIFDRLITYYGPGHSNKLYNSTFAVRLPELEVVAREIDEALGGDYFASVKLGEIVERKAMVRLQKLARRRAKGSGKISRDVRIERLRKDSRLLDDDMCWETRGMEGSA